MLLDEGSSDEETPTKKSQATWDSESEDDALPGTTTMTVAEVVGRASSSKKKYRARAILYSETEDDAVRTAPTMTVEKVADIASPKKKKEVKESKKALALNLLGFLFCFLLFLILYLCSLLLYFIRW